MDKRIFGVLGFLVILTIYVTVLIALAPVLPVVFLTALLAWLIIRRPIAHPGRVDSDIKAFSAKAGDVAGKLVDVLVRPLTGGP